MQTPHDALDYLDDILNAIEKIEITIWNVLYEEFPEEVKTVYADAGSDR